jgi:hypothetical protein
VESLANIGLNMQLGDKIYSYQIGNELCELLLAYGALHKVRIPTLTGTCTSVQLPHPWGATRSAESLYYAAQDVLPSAWHSIATTQRESPDFFNLDYGSLQTLEGNEAWLEWKARPLTSAL